MLTLIQRDLRVDRSRTVLSVLAVAVAITLVIVLEGFKAGLYEQVRSFREQLPGTFVAVPAGAGSTAFARAGIPPSVQEALATVDGVERVSPLVSVPFIFVRGSDRAPVTLVGYSQIGGPPALAVGRGVERQGEAVFDQALARRFGLDVGDSIDLLGDSFRIVGLSDGTASLLGSYVFISIEDAHAAVHPFDQPSGEGIGSANLLLVQLAAGADAQEMRAAINGSVPQVQLLTPPELAQRDVALTEGIMGSTVNVLVIVSYVVGVLVISLTLYASVLEHVREFGVMKAVGAPNGMLYRYVLGQAALMAILGFALAILASLGVAWLISVAIPHYMVLPWQGEVLIRTAIATGVMALLASLIPVRQVAQVEPAVVFRGA